MGSKPKWEKWVVMVKLKSSCVSENGVGVASSKNLRPREESKGEGSRKRKRGTGLVFTLWHVNVEFRPISRHLFPQCVSLFELSFV